MSMAEFPVINSRDRLVALFTAIRGSAVPKRFTYRFLAKLGFKSSGDRVYLPLLKALGFLDSGGKPTPDYQAVRDQSLLAETLREALTRLYQPLFQVDTNLPNVPEDVLIGYFSRFSAGPSSLLERQKEAFGVLCSLADLGANPLKSQITRKPEQEQLAETKQNGKDGHDNKSTRRKVNISINLPTTTDEKVYDSLFRHLKDLLDG